MYIAVFALLVSSVSMSVAWFVASRTLYVNGINISFDADRELLISESKDDGYVDHIDHSQGNPTGVFVPVTSAHSSEWTSQKKDSPIFYDESTASEMEDLKPIEVEEGVGYFTKKYYIKADDDLYITIDPDKTFIKPNHAYNVNYAPRLHEYYQHMKNSIGHDPIDPSAPEKNYKRYEDLSVDELVEYLDGVVNAMRFSILIKDGDEYSYTIIDPNNLQEKETVLGGLLDNDVDDYYDSFKKEGTNDRYERVYGEYVGEPAYGELLAQDSDFTDTEAVPTAFNACHKKGVMPFDKEKAEKENGFAFAKEKAINLQDFKNDIKPFHFPVYMDTPKEVVVSIYIEGWDLDSINYTMGAAFISDLTFKIEREF